MFVARGSCLGVNELMFLLGMGQNYINTYNFRGILELQPRNMVIYPGLWTQWTHTHSLRGLNGESRGPRDFPCCPRNCTPTCDAGLNVTGSCVSARRDDVVICRENTAINKYSNNTRNCGLIGLDNSIWESPVMQKGSTTMFGHKLEPWRRLDLRPQTSCLAIGCVCFKPQEFGWLAATAVLHKLLICPLGCFI